MDLEGRTIPEIQKMINDYQTPYLMTPAEIIKELSHLTPILQSFLEGIDSNPFHRNESIPVLDKSFDIGLPNEAQSWEEILNFLKTKIVPEFSTVANKHVMAYIPGDPAPPAMLGAMLTPVFNQWVGGTLASPGGVAIESLAIKWIIKMLNLPETSWGCFTSGGSMANLTGLYAGLHHQAPWLRQKGYYGGKKLQAYYSEEAHFCVPKALLMLGLGYENLRKIPTNENYQMDIKILKKYLEEDNNRSNIQPAIIIASAGTTNTGAIDPLSELAKLAGEYTMWFHIDAAYGGFAKISNTSAQNSLKGLELADSLALDAHKWLYTPYEAGIAIVSDAKLLKKAYISHADYTVDHVPDDEFKLLKNFKDYSFPLTRELRGLKIWFLIMAYGKKGLSQFITKNILLGKYLEKIVENHPNLELMATSELAVICFRYKTTDEMNDKIILTMQKRRKYYVSRTSLKGKVTIRACILNLRTDVSTIDGLLEELDVVAQELRI